MTYNEFFKDKKVTQLGLGLLGRGVNDAIFMLENGVADLIVTDKKTAEELAPSVEKLKGYSNLTLHLGEHKLEDFKNRDFILKGAGIPLDSPYIVEAKKEGTPIEMDSSLFCKLLPVGVTTIGVTGTRGKSTVTLLLSHILKNVGMKTHIGGNIRDMATLPLIKEVQSGDYVVLELDSWQLQGFGESKISPHIAVFTNFMPDHLNYYKDNPEQYFLDKAAIFKFQKEGDVLVVGEDVVEKVKGTREKGQGEIKIAKIKTVPEDWKPKIIGEHNLQNTACAVEACRALGISEEDIKKGVESFEGVEGRLQFVKDVDGVKIWNDNNSTTPNATIVALEALNPKSEIRNKNIVLIIGGADKNLELKELVEEINQTCSYVVLLPGSGTDRLKPYTFNLTPIFTTSLEEAVKVAMSHCTSGDHLLFSPAFASFGMFKNEYDRNDQFMEIVSKL